MVRGRKGFLEPRRTETKGVKRKKEGKRKEESSSIPDGKENVVEAEKVREVIKVVKVGCIGVGRADGRRTHF